MTCPDRPHDLDLLLVGEPTDDAVASHAAECATCAAEVALAQRIDAALASRRDVVAPASLVADALAQARRQRPLAPAREAVTLRGPAAVRTRRLRATVGALAVVLALAGSWAVWSSMSPTGTTDIAEATPMPPIDEPLAPEAEALPLPDSQPDEPNELNAAPSPPPAAQPALPRPAPRRASPRAPRQRPVQRALPTPAPSPEVAPDTAPDPLLVEAEPTPADIEQAEAELKLAFSLIANAQRQAGRAVRDETGPLSTTLERTLPF